MDVTAAVVEELAGPFVIATVQLDDPGPGEVLVEIAGVGLCHTDLAAKDGHLPFPLPGVFGHEGSGTVLRVGEGVTTVAPGDRVALSFASCGTCTQCQDGAPAYCLSFMPLNFGGARPGGGTALHRDGAELGSAFFGQSSFATHAIALERNTVKVPDDVPLELLGPFGCGIQTGAGAVLNSFDCPAGSSLLVLGGGSVGLSAVMAAAARGLATIVVLEPHAARRALALELGATHVLDPADGPVQDQVRAILPEGINFALDTTGIVAVIEGALAALSQRGTLGFIGVPSDPAAAVPISPIQAQMIGLRLIGIVEGDSDPDVFIPELLELYRSGRFPFEKLITTYPFVKINDAVEAQHRGEAVKIVLTHS